MKWRSPSYVSKPPTTIMIWRSSSRRQTRASIADMLLFWIALVVFLLVTTIGAIQVFRAGLRVWRTLKAFRTAVAEQANALAGAVERLSGSSERAGAAQERLEPSLARLQRSVARGGPARGRAGRARLVRPPHRGVPAQVTRVASVDLGTNTTRLLVADVEGDDVQEIVRRQQITRLGEGVDVRRRLLPVAVARVRNVLADYRREAESLGAVRVLAVATSAVRDAENGEAFLGEIEWSYGFDTRLLSGAEEAELTLRGVGVVDDETVVLDVGGGSTELVTRAGATSVDVGSARMTEQLGEDVDAIAGRVRELLPPLRAARAIGVAGTVTTLAALDLGSLSVHGHILSLRAVEDQLELLAALPLAERRRIPLLEPERAPVIVAGAVIVREAMRALGVDALTVSERDLLDGVALAAAELPPREEGAAPPGAYTCC